MTEHHSPITENRLCIYCDRAIVWRDGAWHEISHDLGCAYQSQNGYADVRRPGDDPNGHVPGVLVR